MLQHIYMHAMVAHRKQDILVLCLSELYRPHAVQTTVRLTKPHLCMVKWFIYNK